MTEVPPPPAATPPAPPLRWRGCLLLAALGALAFGLQLLAATAPEVTERLYARGFYAHLANGLAAASAPFPWSIGESLLLLLLAALLLRLLLGLRAWARGRRRLGHLLARGLLQALALAGVLLASFELLWGLNHARLPFGTQVGLQAAPVDKARLRRVAQKLAERAAAVRPPDLDATEPFLPADWREHIADAYDRAGAQWPCLQGPRPSIRQPWLSPLLTLASITGIYSPWTGEPNVNGDMPQLEWPFVACHEVAHLRGYAREDEANFIAWWVGSRAEDRLVAYACELGAYRTVLRELWAADLGGYQAVRAATAKPVTADCEVLAGFWRRRPPVATKVLTAITETTNDLYLKGAGHKAGVRSYGRMVDLLVAALDP